MWTHKYRQFPYQEQNKTCAFWWVQFFGSVSKIFESFIKFTSLYLRKLKRYIFEDERGVYTEVFSINFYCFEATNWQCSLIFKTLSWDISIVHFVRLNSFFFNALACVYSNRKEKDVRHYEHIRNIGKEGEGKERNFMYI